MAEVASGVLHNVGNVMNSVNVGASVTRDAVEALPVERLARALATCSSRTRRGSRTISRTDPTGRKLPEYLRKLGDRTGRGEAGDPDAARPALDASRAHEEDHRGAAVVCEGQRRHGGMHARGNRRDGAVDQRGRAAQQQHRGRARLREAAARARRPPPDHADPRESGLQREARARGARACPSASSSWRSPRSRAASAIEVRDNGIGIRRENLAKIFNHGFTTKKEGPRLRPAQLRERGSADGRQPHGLQRRAWQGRELRAADTRRVRGGAAAARRLRRGGGRGSERFRLRASARSSRTGAS